MPSKVIRRFYWALPVETKNMITKTLLVVIGLPVIRNAYHGLYRRSINKRTASLPRRIVIEPYNICNLKCTMCPYPLMTRPKVQMSMRLFKKIVDDAAQNGIYNLCLNNYNEPLLDRMLFERIKYAKQTGMRVGFFSNGTLLTVDNISEIMETGLDWIFLSVDGVTKRDYESIRVGANFETTVSSIRDLLKYRRETNSKLSIRICSTVQQNIHGTDEMQRLFYGADGFSVEVADNRKKESGTLEAFRKINRPSHLWPCKRIWKDFVVLSSGRVCLCCADYDGSIELGDLNNQTIPEIWNSPKFRQIRQLHLSGQGDRIHLCRDCDILYWDDSAFYWWFD